MAGRARMKERAWQPVHQYGYSAKTGAIRHCCRCESNLIDSNWEAMKNEEVDDQKRVSE